MLNATASKYINGKTKTNEDTVYFLAIVWILTEHPREQYLGF